MAPPTPLSITTNSITRLLKEESSYRTELASQQQRVAKLQASPDDGEGEDEGGNGEFRLRQEVRQCFIFNLFHLIWFSLVWFSLGHFVCLLVCVWVGGWVGVSEVLCAICISGSWDDFMADAFSVCVLGGIETSSRGDESGVWAVEGEDFGGGGEVGGAVGGFASLLVVFVGCAWWGRFWMFGCLWSG